MKCTYISVWIKKRTSIHASLVRTHVDLHWSTSSTIKNTFNFPRKKICICGGKRVGWQKKKCWICFIFHSSSASSTHPLEWHRRARRRLPFELHTFRFSTRRSFPCYILNVELLLQFHGDGSVIIRSTNISSHGHILYEPTNLSFFFHKDNNTKKHQEKLWRERTKKKVLATFNIFMIMLMF